MIDGQRPVLVQVHQSEVYDYFVRVEHGFLIVVENLDLFEKNFVSAGVLVDEDCFEGATVILKCDGAVKETAATNCFGDFKFDGLDDGEYVIEIEAGGRTASRAVKIDNKSLNLGFIKL